MWSQGCHRDPHGCRRCADIHRSGTAIGVTQKGAVMTALRRTLTVLAGAVTSLCTATMLASAAFAQVPPSEPPYLQPPIQAPTVTAVADGSPWWVFALVAVGAAALTLVARAGTTLRHPGPRPAHF